MHRLIISFLAIIGLTAMLQADAWNKKTELTVKETIRVPGATLTPGKYVVKLLNSDANRHIVQFMNETEDKVISTVLAIPNQRLRPSGESEFSFYETSVGGAPTLRAWFYPGDTFGQEFAYPKQEATELARATGQDVPSIGGEDLESSEVTTISANESNTAAASNEPRTTQPQEPVAQARTQPAVPRDEPAPRPDPTVLAQAEPRAQEPSTPREAAPAPRPSQQPAPREADRDELPATGSPAPLLGLLGFLSLGGALALRRLAKPVSR